MATSTRLIGLILTAWAALAGCDQVRVTAPSKADAPTYLNVFTPARPYAQATKVVLEVDMNEHVVSTDPITDTPTYRLAEHPRLERGLTPDERADLEKHIKRLRHIGVLPEREEPALVACFVPHHVFNYYAADGSKIGEIAVCFCCAGYQARPALPFGDGQPWRDNQLVIDLFGLRGFVRGLGIRIDMQCMPDQLGARP